MNEVSQIEPKMLIEPEIFENDYDSSRAQKALDEALFADWMNADKPKSFYKILELLRSIDVDDVMQLSNDDTVNILNLISYIKDNPVFLNKSKELSLFVFCYGHFRAEYFMRRTDPKDNVSCIWPIVGVDIFKDKQKFYDVRDAKRQEFISAFKDFVKAENTSALKEYFDSVLEQAVHHNQHRGSVKDQFRNQRLVDYYHNNIGYYVLPDEPPNPDEVEPMRATGNPYAVILLEHEIRQKRIVDLKKIIKILF